VTVDGYNKGAPKFMPNKKAITTRLRTIDGASVEEARTKTIETPEIIHHSLEVRSEEVKEEEEPIAQEDTAEKEKKFVYSDVDSTSEEEQQTIVVSEAPLEIDKKGNITAVKPKRNDKNAQTTSVKPKRKRRKEKILINLHYTCYPIVKRAARYLGYRLKRTDLSLGQNVPPTLAQALDNY